MINIVILSSTRTPIGSFQGDLAALPAPRLGAIAIQGALAKAGVEPGVVSDVFLGNVLQAGLGQAPARQAALYAGLQPSTRCATFNKVCGSGLEAVLAASRALAVGDATMAVAGGMESMSNTPYLLLKARSGYRLGHQQVVDGLINDGLWDPYNNLHMGNCAESCAAKYSFTRELQDAFAIESFRRANAAQKEERFAQEITPVEITDAKGNVTHIETDEGPAKVKYDKIPSLKPAFQKDGTITAANASTLNDGAAALILTTDKHATAKNLNPVARIVAYGSHSQEPKWFTTAPVQATQSALSKAGWSIEDVDLWEVNEAFAVVPISFMRELGVAHEKVNVRGGAIALGHPIGASGARILVTLIASLKERGLKTGVAAICIGGGEGLAICIELL